MFYNSDSVSQSVLFCDLFRSHKPSKARPCQFWECQYFEATPRCCRDSTATQYTCLDRSTETNSPLWKGQKNCKAGNSLCHTELKRKAKCLFLRTRNVNSKAPIRIKSHNYILSQSFLHFQTEKQSIIFFLFIRSPVPYKCVLLESC